MEDKNLAKLSNPFSVGGGGFVFEQRVQATFLLLLMMGSFSPIMNVPIKTLTFQAKRLGWNVDDLLVVGKRNDIEIKMLCQIKHTITITKKDENLKKVVSAAWNDVQNKSFQRRTDRICLITGLIQKEDMDALKFINEQAVYAKDAQDFLDRIYKTRYSSQSKMEKFEILCQHLNFANSNVELSDKEKWTFFKIFSLLVFDLDYEYSVNQVLMKSLIKCSTNKDVQFVWEALCKYAGDCDCRAASVSLNNLNEDIAEIFNINNGLQQQSIIMNDFKSNKLWAALVIIGTWNEKNNKDKEFITKIVDMPYCEFEQEVRKLLYKYKEYISFNNGIWKINSRRQLFLYCTEFYFDEMIERIFSVGEKVLTQKNKRFNSANEYNFMVPYGSDYDNSSFFREGITRGMCMLSNNCSELKYCSDNKVHYEAHKMLKNVFTDCEWTQWASLTGLLWLIAEIFPAKYLDLLEKYIIVHPERIKQLFPMKNTNFITDPNFLSSVLWSVEVLAWDESYLIQCIRCLTALEKIDYDETNHSNTPINSIVQIMFPFYPQTKASFEKQKNAITYLRREAPEIAWEIAVSAILRKRTIFTENPKPQYCFKVPENKESVSALTKEEYCFYLELTIALAKENIIWLEKILANMDCIDQKNISLLLEHIMSVKKDFNQEEQFRIWNKLCDAKIAAEDFFIKKKLELPPFYNQLIDVIAVLEPDNICFKYRRLYLRAFHKESRTMESWEKREQQKANAVFEIYREYGIQAVEDFGVKVNNVYDVSAKLGRNISRKDVSVLMKKYYNGEIKSSIFIPMLRSYIFLHKEDALLEIGLANYPTEFIAPILSKMNITTRLIQIVEMLLPKNESLFWCNVDVSWYFQSDCDYDPCLVASKLMEYGRYSAIIKMFGLTEEIPITYDMIYEALLKAPNSEDYNQTDSDNMISS